MKRLSLIPLLLLCGAPLFFAGCTGFPRGWHREIRKTPSHPVAGAWQGTWHSTGTGHQGKLRCVVTARGDGRFDFRYRATWAKVLCGGYSVTCSAAPGAEGRWTVTGEKNLGPLFGGVFTHRGIIQGDRFTADYSSRLDRGGMEMQRVRPAAPRKIPEEP